MQKSTNGRIMLLNSHGVEGGMRLLGCMRRYTETYLQEAPDITKDGRSLSKITIRMAAVQTHKNEHLKERKSVFLHYLIFSVPPCDMSKDIADMFPYTSSPVPAD